MEVGPTGEREKSGSGCIGSPHPAGGPGGQQGGFFSEIRFPISFFPTLGPPDGPWTGSLGEHREADFREEQ